MRDVLRSWKSLGIVTASTFVAAGFTLLITLVAAATLAKGGFGQFIFFLSVSTFVGSFLDLGVSLQMMMEHSTRNHPDPEAHLARSWSAQLWSYGGGVLLAACLSVPAGRYFDVPSSLVVLGAVHGGLAGLFNFVTSVLQVRQRWSARGKATIRQALIRSGATLVGLAFGSAIFGAVGAVIGAAAGLLINLLNRDLAEFRSAFRTLSGLRSSARVWRRSHWFAILICAAAAAEYAPIAFVARVGGDETLAVFGLAAQLATGPSLVLLSLLTFLLPAASDPSVPFRDYFTLLKRSLAPTLAVFVLSAVAAPVVIPFVFGRDFTGAVLPFELLLIATAVFALAIPLQIIHLRFGDSRTWALIDLVRLAFLALGLALFPSWFALPIAAGTAVVLSAVGSRTIGIVALLKLRKDHVRDSIDA